MKAFLVEIGYQLTIVEIIGMEAFHVGINREDIRRRTGGGVRGGRGNGAGESFLVVYHRGQIIYNLLHSSGTLQFVRRRIAPRIHPRITSESGGSSDGNNGCPEIDYSSTLDGAESDSDCPAG